MKNGTFKNGKRDDAGRVKGCAAGDWRREPSRTGKPVCVSGLKSVAVKPCQGSLSPRIFEKVVLAYGCRRTGGYSVQLTEAAFDASPTAGRQPNQGKAKQIEPLFPQRNTRAGRPRSDGQQRQEIYHDIPTDSPTPKLRRAGRRDRPARCRRSRCDG